MDFSLLQPHTHHRFLRDITALKHRWPYYLIMVLDPILRFNWVFYAIFAHDTQHSSIASFLIAFSEITRRGMWTLLRVENEHCANVKQYKASRDVPLPYHLDMGVETDPLTSSGPVSSDSGRDGGGGKQAQRPDDDDDDDNDNELVRSPSAARVSWTGAVARTHSARSTGVDVPASSSSLGGAGGSGGAAGPSGALEEGRTPPGEEAFRMRRRRADTIGKRSIRGMLADAHKQDFEKKRKPETGRGGLVDGVDEADEEDDEEDDDDDLAGSDGTEETGSLLDDRMEVREAEMLTRQERGGASA